jgi:hypothetical protein
MKAIAKGLCWGHYARARRGKDVGVAIRVGTGGKAGRAIKYGCRRPTFKERRLAMFRWQLAEGLVTPEPNTGCLLWLGRSQPTGYGVVGSSRDPWGGYAHRAALYLAGVPLPRGTHYFHVRHLCNNPACVSLDHLRLGTAKENMADRTARYESGDLKHARWHRDSCKHGHDCGYTETASGNRYCRECSRLAHAKYAHQTRSAA